MNEANPDYENRYGVVGTQHRSTDLKDTLAAARQQAASAGQDACITRNGREWFLCDAEGVLSSYDEVSRMASGFSKKLASLLTPHELGEVIRRNKATPTPGTCASHDFLDANTVMADAFAAVFGRPPDPRSDMDQAAWTRAWAMAKDKDFYQSAHRQFVDTYRRGR